jgi:hypothetical protein
MVLADISAAAKAGGKRMPWPARTPAASRIAKMLERAAHQRFWIRRHQRGCVVDAIADHGDPLPVIL